MPIRVTIWNEFRHEKKNEAVRALYPEGIHAYIRDFLACDELEITLAALDDPAQGLPDEVLNNTDVLLWWGHLAHHVVEDALVERINARVQQGMGMLFLHSGMEEKKLAVSAATHINLNHICTLLKCNFVSGHCVAGNVASCCTSVGSDNYVFLCFFSQ